MNFIFLLLSMLLLSSCMQNGSYTSTDYKEEVINIEDYEVDTINFANSFNFEVVPLDNKSIVGSVSKMIVTNRGYYVLDSRANPDLSLYAHDGKFIRKFDMKGHSKKEYTKIFNFTASETGDTIAILDNLGKIIKLYDEYGHYLSQHTFDDEYGWDDCAIIDNHFYMVSYHGGCEGIITKYDNNFSNKEVIGSGHIPLTPGAGIYGTKFIQTSSSKICYMDYFHSCFYLIDKKSDNEIIKYTLNSTNILNPEYEPRKFFEYDQILSYTLANDYLYFEMSYQGGINTFRIDLADGKLYKVDNSPNFLGYKDGCFYYCMSADNMRICIDNDSYFHKNIKRLNAFLPYKDMLKVQENLVIIKCKQ